MEDASLIAWIGGIFSPFMDEAITLIVAIQAIPAIIAPISVTIINLKISLKTSSKNVFVRPSAKSGIKFDKKGTKNSTTKKNGTTIVAIAGK